jgi:hypothetical protein
MVEVIKVFMNKETLLTLEDHFENDEKQTLHRFFYESLRELAKTSKIADDNRSIAANVFQDGQMNQETFQYKDLDLEKYALGSDPNWRPINMVETEEAVFEMKVGDKTHNHLLKYCKLFGVRVNEFNKSIPTVKRMEEGVEVVKPDPRYKELELAKCFEEVIHKALYDPIQRLLNTTAQEIFDKEFEEIEKAEKEAKEKSAPAPEAA